MAGVAFGVMSILCGWTACPDLQGIETDDYDWHTLTLYQPSWTACPDLQGIETILD